jgi:hypothetical protein
MKRSAMFLLIAIWVLAACSPGGSAPPTRAPLLPTQSSGPGPAATSVAPPAQLPTASSGGGEVLFQDDFSDPNSGWDSSASDNGSTDYGSGDYVIHVDTSQYSMWANPSRSFSGGVSVEVDALPTAGPNDNELGVICNYQDTTNFMYATISSDGFYGILRLKDDSIDILTGGGKLQPTDTIKQGQVKNHMQLICQNGQYSLIVNGQPVDSVADSSFTGGDVGLLAGTFDTGGVEIHFDNFVVSKPSASSSGPIGPAATPVQSLAAMLYKDDFSDPNSGWDIAQTDNGSTGYGNGVYEIQVDTPQYSLWANPNRSFGDVAVEVDAVPVAGPEANEMGIICRYQDIDNFMYASIGNDGYYAIYEIKDNNVTVLTGNGKLITSDAIHQGSAAGNHLMFVCKGSRYTLSVNGQEVDSVTDNTFSTGDVGLLAGTFDTGGVKIDFDNFLVTVP